MEKLVKVYTSIDLDQIKVIDSDGKYVACMVHLSASDGTPFTYFNFSLIGAESASDCREKYLAMRKSGGCFSDEFTDCIVGDVTGRDSAQGLLFVILEMKAMSADTVGKNQYVVGSIYDGAITTPRYAYRDFQIISADSQEDAKSKYYEINHLGFVQCMCLGLCLEVVNGKPFNPQRSYCDLVTEPTVKVPTRSEYYESLGFSGSEIERPDDPIDDEFVKHCRGLKTIAEGFVDYCKQTAECVKDPSGIKEYHGIVSHLSKEEMEDCARLVHETLYNTSIPKDQIDQIVVKISDLISNKSPEEIEKALDYAYYKTEKRRRNPFGKVLTWIEACFIRLKWRIGL